jgi:hypothetical protein
MSLQWDALYKLGTDVAAFMFFHPKQLEHRKQMPMGWWDTQFRDEFLSGRLVAFYTGSDGTFTMKFVQRPLTAVEKKVLVVKECFRYEAQDGRMYWDNSDHLPSEDQMANAEDDPEGWLEVTDGRYRVTVNAMDWYSIPDSGREAEEDISHYVVRFEKVASFDDIPVPTKLPWLIASKKWHEKRSAQEPGQ